MDPNKPIIMKARDKNREIQITPNEICYCKAEGCYTWIYLASGEKHLISRPLGQLEKQLNKERFVRCHKSYVVNVSKIININIEKGIIVQRLYQIPISKRKIVELLYKCYGYILK